MPKKKKSIPKSQRTVIQLLERIALAVEHLAKRHHFVPQAEEAPKDSASE